jgi:hypothetical protein
MKEARLEELRRKCVEEKIESPECDNVLDEKTLNARETKALVSNGLDISDLDFTHDKENVNIGLASLVNIEKNPNKVAKFKLKNPVPIAVKMRVTPPSYLSLLVYETTFIKPITVRSKSPVKNSISKAGLPALPNLSVSQFVALNPSTKVPTNNGNILDQDFLKF